MVTLNFLDFLIFYSLKWHSYLILYLYIFKLVFGPYSDIQNVQFLIIYCIRVDRGLFIYFRSHKQITKIRSRILYRGSLHIFYFTFETFYNCSNNHAKRKLSKSAWLNICYITTVKSQICMPRSTPNFLCFFCFVIKYFSSYRVVLFSCLISNYYIVLILFFKKMPPAFGLAKCNNETLWLITWVDVASMSPTSGCATKVF